MPAQHPTSEAMGEDGDEWATTAAAPQPFELTDAPTSGGASAQPTEAYRLALLPYRFMLPINRAKVLGVVNAWSIEKMRVYLHRRIAYIRRQGDERLVGSEVPLVLSLVASQLVAWFDRRSDEFKALRAHVQSVKLQEFLRLIEELCREHSRWNERAAKAAAVPVAAAAPTVPMFIDARDKLISILNSVRSNILVDSVQCASVHFDSTSQALLEIMRRD